MEGLNLDMRNKLVIVMVGLPARGKSYVTKKLCRYLNWLQYEVKIFNVGDRRRTKQRVVSNLLSSDPGADVHKKLEAEKHAASFFNFENTDARKFREAVAMETLDELLDYLTGNHGSVALFDATNTTVTRRKSIVQKIRERGGNDLQILFLESQCFNESLLQSNLRLKLSGPDYEDRDPVVAMNDFKERVKQYEKIYVPIGENEEAAGYSFCQMIDVGRKFVMHNIKGYLATQTVHYLQHFNLSPRQIWLTRHGESMGDVEGKFGGNSDLSHYGVQYAKTLSRFIAQQCNLWAQGHLSKENTPIDSPSHPASHTAITGKSFHVWTSNMKRSIQTAQHFNPCTYEIEHLRMLDELNAGILEGLTRDKIKEFYGDWLGQRQEDKLRHRYPGTSGEGYVDLTNRLKSVILEVERLTDHVLIISGLAVTRVLLAYFKGLQRDKITDLRVPLGTLYLIEPKPYGIEYKEFLYDGEIDWFKPTEKH